MNPYPRFPAEHFIFEYLKEVDRYESLFRDRVARAFDGLEDEAKRIEDAEYARLSESFDPDHADPSHGAEKAYFAGVEYYLTVQPTPCDRALTISSSPDFSTC